VLKLDVNLEISEGTGSNKVAIVPNVVPTGETEFKKFLEYLRNVLISVSVDVLQEEQALGFTKEPRTFVDGRRGKPIDQVNPFGKIEFIDPSKFEAKEIIIETLQALIDRSPILEGKYIQSHIVAYNNALIASSVSELKAWFEKDPPIKEGDNFSFINTQPYARKLERLGVRRGGVKQPRPKAPGRNSRRNNSSLILQPNGAYYLTYRQVRRKYRRAKAIRFGFVPGSSFNSFSGIDFNSKERRFRSRPNLRGKKEQRAGVGRTYLYPQISIVI
jgi:hypothetical protein